MKKTMYILLFSIVYTVLIVVPIGAIVNAPTPSAQELIYSRYYDWSSSENEIFIYDNASYKVVDPRNFEEIFWSFKHVSEKTNYYIDTEHIISKTPSSDEKIKYYLLVSLADQDVIMLIPKNAGTPPARPFGWCLVKQDGDEE